MKKKTAGILLGVMVSSMLLSACGNNEAKEAANESVQVEEEGKGERTEEGEKVEAEETPEASEDSASAAGDSENNDSGDNSSESNSDEDKSGDPAAAESDGDSEEETDETAEAPKGKIGVLLSQDDDNASVDAEEMTDQIADGGYEAEIKNANGDADLQISQIQECIDEEVSALIINPVDPYGLADILNTAKEKEIPVISYDKLIRDTAAVNYYASYDTRAIGNEIGKEIVKKMSLEKAQEDKKSYTIEFLMGSPDDNGALFLCNGILEVLQEYLDDGTLVCKSGNTTFDTTGIMRWSESSAKAKLESVLDEFYAEEKTPDIICTAYDGFTYGVQDVLKDAGILPESEEWPLITGYGSEAQAVKDVAEGELAFTMFMDRKELAKGGAQMAIDYLTGEKVDVKDYSQYDNGVKIVGTFTCTAQMIDKDNYQILVDNGTYTEDEIRPDPTPSPEPTATPVPTETPEATETPALTEVPDMTGTPAPTETQTSSEAPESTETPTPAAGKSSDDKAA